MAESISEHGRAVSAAQRSKLKQTPMSAEFWWNKDDTEQAAGAIFASVLKLEHAQAGTLRADLQHFRQFMGNDRIDAMGLFGDSGGVDGTMAGPIYRPVFNGIESILDTLTSMIAGNKPRITFLTDGGSWGQKRKAELLEQYNDGIYYQTKIYDIAPMVFRDAGIMGTGILYVYIDPDTSEIKCERVLRPEITVDEFEALYGFPRQLYRKKMVNRDVLLATYPDSEREILSASPGSQLGTRTGLADLINVIEAWHLPSSQDAGDGRHSISINTDLLFDEEYPHDFLPFLFYRFSERPVGFWGRGLVEQIGTLQDCLNNTYLNIDEAIDICGKPIVFGQKDSKVDWDKMSGGHGSIVTHDGARPEIVAHEVVPASVFQHKGELKSDMYEASGVSQLSASGVKPQGLNSGEAQRVYHDRQTLRFQTQADNYDRFFLQYSDLTLKMTRIQYEEDPKIFVRLPGNQKFVKKIKWNEIDLQEDEYEMKMYPTNMLSKEPAGRLAQLQEMIEAGWIDRDQAMLLADVPDLKSITSLNNAAVKHAEYVIDRILNHSEMIAPTKFENAQTSMKMVQSALLDAMDNGAPQKNIDMLADWLDQMGDIIKAKQQQDMQDAMQAQSMQQAQQQQANPKPQGTPAPAPQSNLIPFPTAGQPPGA